MRKRVALPHLLAAAAMLPSCSSSSSRFDAGANEAAAESRWSRDAEDGADSHEQGLPDAAVAETCAEAGFSYDGTNSWDSPEGLALDVAALDAAALDALSGADSDDMLRPLCDSDRLTCVRAAFQAALNAIPTADGGYAYEPVRVQGVRSPSPGGFGIAVIDSGAYIASMTLYRDRVLGHYAPVDDHYEAIDPQISLPAPVVDLLGDTLAANPDYAASVDTVDLAGPFRRKFNLELLSNPYYGSHGDWVVNPLAEMNPSAYFLLFHEDRDESGQAQRLTCAIRQSDGPAHLRAFWRARGQSVARIIDSSRAGGADIRFVNLSMGIDPEYTVTSTRKICPELQFTPDELILIQRAYAEYLEQITAADVVLVQASIYDASAQITEGNWQNWYSDCQSMPNRVRVGYAVGDKGMPAADRIDTHTRAGLHCIDLLVGMGYAELETPTERAVRISTLGTGHAVSPMVFGSSMAAPFGLSVVTHYWANGHERDGAAALAGAFRSNTHGIPVIKDILEDHLFLNSRDDYINNLQRRAGAEDGGSGASRRSLPAAGGWAPTAARRPTFDGTAQAPR